MKNKSLKYIFSLMLFSVLLIVGCGGGGTQRVLTQETPEAAVMRIADSWRVSNNSPAVVVDNSNRFVRQARAEEITPTPVDGSSTKDSQQSSSKDIITLYDLAASDTYELKVLNVEKSDTSASVECSFLYGKEGYLILLFKLVFDEGKWWLDDVVITNKPIEKGKALYTVKYIGLDAKDNAINLKSYQETDTIGKEITIASLPFDGYEFIEDYSDNVPSGKITEDSELVLKLYYRKIVTAQYVVNHIKLDANGVAIATETERLTAKVDSEVVYKVQKDKYTDYTYVEISDKTKTSGKVKSDGSLVLFLYYQYNVEAKYTVKLIDVDTQEEIPGYTYSTEPVILGKVITLTLPKDLKGYEFAGKEEDLKVTVSKNNIEFKLYFKKVKGYQISGTIDDGSSVLQGVTVQVFKSDNPNVCITETTTDKEGFYSVTVDSEGTYLVVVTGNGYEPKTIMVTVPKENTNIRLSCKL